VGFNTAFKGRGTVIRSHQLQSSNTRFSDSGCSPQTSVLLFATHSVMLWSTVSGSGPCRTTNYLQTSSFA